MPTSSQALILKVTDGHLPPIFGRRVWRPALSQNYPVSNINLSHRLYQYCGRPGPANRTTSAKNLNASQGLNTLTDLLRVQGLKGDLAYDESIGALNYRVEELPSIRYDGWTEFNQGGRIDSLNHKYNSESRIIRPYRRSHRRRSHNFVKVTVDGENKIEDCSHENADYFKLVKTVDRSSGALDNNETANETNTGTKHTTIADTKRGTNTEINIGPNNVANTEVNNVINPETKIETYKETKNVTKVKELKTVPNVQVKYITGVKANNASNVETQNVSSTEPMSRIQIETQNTTNETKYPTDTEQQYDLENKTYFRLVKATSNDVGAFRLAKTDKREVGEFYLVPPEGHESNEFRLIHSDKPGCYSIFIADPNNPDSFSLLAPEKVHGDEFRMVTAKISDEQLSPLLRRPQHRIKNNIQTNDDDQRYGYFEEVIDRQTHYNSRRKEFSLPDLMLNDPNKRLHTPGHESNDTYDFNAEDFAAKYLQDVNDDSSEVYERLASLGFRTAVKDNPVKPVAKSNDTLSGSSSKLASAEWRTYNFDKWTRTTEASSILEDVFTVESARLVEPNKSPDVGPSKASLLGELKMNSNYKQWKKKKVVSVRARKELPPEDPNAVCLTLSDNAISHDVLMQHVQRGTGNQLMSLQFDPISVHTSVGEAKSQWILRFSDQSTCDKLLKQGISILGKNYQARRYDDVMKEEHDAYKFNEIIQQIKDHKSKKDQTRKSKKLKTTETQTMIGV